MNDKEKFMRQALAGKPEQRESGNVNGPRAPIGVAKIVPFGNWDYYYLSSPIGWFPEGKYVSQFPPIEVPRGFVTDLASVPRILWSIMPPTSTYTHATIIHDYLYWTQFLPRSHADKILKIGMKELNVSAWRRAGIYRSLRLFGGFAWSKNAKRKKQGQRRILAKFPTDPKITWKDWKLRPGVFTS